MLLLANQISNHKEFYFSRTVSNHKEFYFKKQSNSLKGIFKSFIK